MSQAPTTARPTWRQALPRPEDITPELFTELLAEGGHELDVASVRCERVGTGQIGDTVRFHVTYRSVGTAEKAPSTIIGKFASTDPTSLAVAEAWSLYEREVRFYREIAGRARLDTPACYCAVMDQAGRFLLLLEDLAPAAPGDQFAGVALADAKRAVREAARLHAAFWECETDPALAWLDTGPKAQPFYGPETYRDTWPRFRERYGDKLESHHLDVCNALFEGYDVYNRPRPAPRCVTHNDFRPDNMLISANRLTVVDWQSVALGTNAVDIAYLIGGSYEPEARRAVEADLIAAYRTELANQGVTNQSADAFEREYRHFTFAGINVAVGAAMLVKRTERGDRMFLTMLDRHVTHVRDANAVALLTE